MGPSDSKATVFFLRPGLAVSHIYSLGPCKTSCGKHGNPHLQMRKLRWRMIQSHTQGHGRRGDLANRFITPSGFSVLHREKTELGRERLLLQIELLRAVTCSPELVTDKDGIFKQRLKQEGLGQAGETVSNPTYSGIELLSLIVKSVVNDTSLLFPPTLLTLPPTL